ncbi:hypothetical protein ACF1B0_13370 [Streptomyces anandii]|uniref:hypothetical protein n=1 Tax=Streptomyces anandii TaxID=285454 RepID=UPI0036FE74FA
MTQSGQGEEPSARPAREGIVLPSDGGEPLLPGMTGGPGGRPPAHSAAQPPAHPAGQEPAAAPAEGRAWGQPWGPGHQQTQAQAQPAQPGQGWPAAPGQQPWGAPEPYQQAPQWDAQGGAVHPGAGPLPPEGAPAPSGYGQDAYASAPAGPGAPLPSAGGDPYAPAAGHGAHGTHGAHPAHAAQGPHGAQAAPQGPHAAAGGQGLPQPPAGAGGPYAPAGHGVPGHGAPGVDEGATQFLPPVAVASADEGATQFLPPVPAAPVNEGATQFLPPVAPGALPPEGAGDPSTHYLGRIPQGGGTGPLPPSAAPQGPDAEATQYIAPVDAQAGGRHTPAEFDNLFRSAGGPAPAAGPSTQQIPPFQQPSGGPAYAPAGPAGPGAGPYGGPDDDGDGSRGGRRGSRVPLIAAVGVGIVVLGVGAGALLGGGGGGDGQSGDKNKNVSATAPATDGATASAAADPARQQAVQLDKLLADSGSSRASVIKAVADVKNCDNLGEAASNLRDAAKQRNDLVTRLGQLSVDKLPDNAALTAALNSAWKASAEADRHYAAWAGQVGGKKGCKKGHARTTGETQAGNRESGVASAQKVKAARLWNAIAQKYGLTQRQPVQL